MERGDRGRDLGGQKGERLVEGRRGPGRPQRTVPTRAVAEGGGGGGGSGGPAVVAADGVGRLRRPMEAEGAELLVAGEQVGQLLTEGFGEGASLEAEAA